MTYADLADMLGVSPNTLYVWRHRGKLPPPDIDNFQPLWKEETIREWMRTWTDSNTKSTN